MLFMSTQGSAGEVDVKTAYVPEVDSVATKTTAGFLDNPKMGLKSTSGVVVLFSARSGRVDAALLNKGYLTDV